MKEHCPEETLDRVTAVTAMMKDRVSFVKELWPLCSFFFVTPTEYDEKTVKKRWKEDSAQQLSELVQVLEGIDDFSLENQEQIPSGLQYACISISFSSLRLAAFMYILSASIVDGR